MACVTRTPELAVFVVAAVNAYHPVAEVQAEVAKIETLKASLAELSEEARRREPEKDASFGIVHRRR
jgi:cell division protein ZapA (FtsZ GTPase activity inhibitor)